MKKILTLVITLAVFCSAAFSKNFFSDRIFELKLGADVNASNNIVSANEYMKKEIVIDLKKIASECPEGGANVNVMVNPRFEMNLNLSAFNLGIATGVELFDKATIDKSLFTFLGEGNSAGQPLNVAINNQLEAFYFYQIGAGFTVKKFKINVRPAVFIPLFAMSGNGGTATFENGNDGTIKAAVNLDSDIYCAVDVNNPMASLSNISSLTRGMGFDIAGTIELPLSKTLVVGADARIPIVPGRLYNKARVTAAYSYETKIVEMGNGNANFNSDEVKFSNFTEVEDPLLLNRPLTIGAYVNKSVLGSLFNLHAGAGMGARKPFLEGMYVYPEYDLGITLNLIGIFKLNVSTMYKSEVFKHQIGTTLSVRFIQLDVGASVQSSDFVKSFQVAGAGAYAYVTIGF